MSTEELNQEEAGFNAAFGLQTEEAVQEETTEPEVPETLVEEPPEEETIAGMPVSMVKDLLAKVNEIDALKAELTASRDKLAGQIGVLHQKIGNKTTVRKLEKTASEYPELAELLAADLVDVEGQQNPAFDEGKLTEFFSAREKSLREELARERETRLLDRAVPDWRQTIASSDFRLWTSTLDDKTRDELMNSVDSLFIEQQINSYKAFKDAQNAKTNQRQKRLEQAVQPTGTPKESTPVDAEYLGFMSAFKT